MGDTETVPGPGLLSKVGLTTRSGECHPALSDFICQGCQTRKQKRKCPLGAEDSPLGLYSLEPDNLREERGDTRPPVRAPDVVERSKNNISGFTYFGFSFVCFKPSKSMGEQDGGRLKGQKQWKEQGNTVQK